MQSSENHYVNKSNTVILTHMEVVNITIHYIGKTVMFDSLLLNSLHTHLLHKLVILTDNISERHYMFCH